MTLKESFDKKEVIDVIRVQTEIYKAELEKLKLVCPEDILTNDLLRHSALLSKYVTENKLEWCYSDIYDLCYDDIFIAGELYLHFVTDTTDPNEKFYDWVHIHPSIEKVARKRFENNHCADAVEASFKEINNVIKKKYK